MTLLDLYKQIEHIGRSFNTWEIPMDKEWHLCYGEIAGDDLINSKITHWMAIPKNENNDRP